MSEALVKLKKRDAQTLLAWLMAIKDSAETLQRRLIDTGDSATYAVLQNRIDYLKGMTDILFEALGKDVNP